MKHLTIFTPTYNRAYILPKLYDSLCREPSNLFIWLIVDDGSTDNTQELVLRWKCEKKIEIVYHKQSNGGKMRAHNTGVKLCTTSLFFCVDSDDQIEKGAIQKIMSVYTILQANDSLSGVIAKKYMVNGNDARKLPKVERSTLHNIYKSGFEGETSLVFKTAILRKFLFPEIEGELFVTEGYVYDQIDQEYELLVLDDFLMRCEYLADGYTSNTHSLFIKYPKGWALYYAQHYQFYAKSIRDKIKYMGLYISMCKLAKAPFFKMVKLAPSPLICLLSIPVGLKFYNRIVLNSRKNEHI